MAAAADHLIVGNDDTTSHTHVEPDWARTTVGTHLAAGRTAGDHEVRVLRLVGPTVGAGAARPGRRCAVRRGAHRLGRAAGRAADYLDEFWDGADVEVEGDPSVQQAVRFGLFHVLQAGARAEQRPIAAKGLTGTGYDGHAFWDTETYVLPVLTATAPHAAADALQWRHSTLDLAIERATTLQPERSRLPVADDPRSGMRRLLAGRDGGVSRQRRHRGGRGPLCALDG